MSAKDIKSYIKIIEEVQKNRKPIMELTREFRDNVFKGIMASKEQIQVYDNIDRYYDAHGSEFADYELVSLRRAGFKLSEDLKNELGSMLILYFSNSFSILKRVYNEEMSEHEDSPDDYFYFEYEDLLEDWVGTLVEFLLKREPFKINSNHFLTKSLEVIEDFAKETFGENVNFYLYGLRDNKNIYIEWMG